MTDARVEKVHADRIRAREFHTQATSFFAGADTPSLNEPSQVVLLHTAAINACDAILQAVGLRVKAGDRAHVLRIKTALEQLDVDTDDLFERLDAARERRNEASYAASFVASTSLEEAREATAELIELARPIVGA